MKESSPAKAAKVTLSRSRLSRVYSLAGHENKNKRHQGRWDVCVYATIAHSDSAVKVPGVPTGGEEDFLVRSCDKKRLCCRFNA
jgi:hypothetical protein